MKAGTRLGRWIRAVLLAGWVAPAMGQPWFPIQPSGALPAPRQDHTVVYDASSGRMILFAGFGPGGPVNDLWWLTNALGQGASSWIQASPTGNFPAPRSQHTTVYDVANNRLILFGGISSASYLNDVWVLANANGVGTVGAPPAWVRLFPAGTPPTIRGAHTAVYDGASNRMIVFGGFDGTTGSNVSNNETWILSNANGLGGTPAWTLLNTGPAPGPRWAHGAGYDATGNRMIIFGGTGGSGNDTWVLNNANGNGQASWTQLSPGGTLPAPRVYFGSVYDSFRNRFVIHGGFFMNDLSDVWVLTGANGSGASTWFDITPVTSVAPGPRDSFAMVYDGTLRRMTLFGGIDSTQFRSNSVWTMNNATGVDTVVTTNPAGLAITVDGAAATGPQTYLWGEGTTHTVAVSSPQGSGGTRYSYSGWSDGGAQSHGVSGQSSATTLTASFLTEYQLNLTASPANWGTVSASPASSNGFYGSGSGVQITATAAAGYAFANFSGDLTGTVNPQTVTMSGPRNVVANFACAYALSSSSVTVGGGAGSGSVNMTAGSTCSWTVSGAPFWLTVTSGGTGSGTINYSYQANTGLNPRTANLVIGGQPLTITQQGISLVCTYTLSAPGASLGPGSGTGTVSVTAPVGCAWNASGSVPSWLTLESGSSGTGNGTLVFSVTANPNSGARSVTLTVAGNAFTITQAGIGCSIGLNPAQASLPSSGGTGSFNVTASAPDCAHPAAATVPWITVTSGSNTNGSGPIGYSFQANPSPNSRSGAITVGPVSFAVTQAGTAPCAFAFGASLLTFVAAGGAGTVTVSTQAGCNWTAVSSVGFLTLGNGSGSGPGTLTFTVAGNGSNDSRSGTVNIGSASVTIEQAGLGSVIACQVAPAVSQAIRAEGRTELLKDLLIRCTGTAPVGGLSGDLTVRLNTPVTSRKLDGASDTSEAVLQVNDPATPQAGVSAFFGTVAGFSTLRWTGVPLLPAGTNVTQSLRLSNVRVDASALGAGDRAQAVTATVAIQAAVAVPLTNAVQTVALASAGTLFQAGQPGPGNLPSQTIVPLLFQEPAPNTFKVRQLVGQDSESGTANLAQLGSRVGLADTGTRFRVVISGVPAGGVIRAPLASVDGKAVLVGADANGNGGGPVPGSVPVAIPLTNGTGTVTWEITSTDPSLREMLLFPLIVENVAATGIQVAGNLAAVSGVGVSSATAPVPRFRDFSVPQTLVNLRATAQLLGGNGPVRAPGGGLPVAGSNVSFSGIIVNGSQTAAPNVVISGNVPAALEIQSCSTSSGDPCGSTPDGGIRVTLPSLDAGATETVTVNATVRSDFPSGGVMQVTFTASSDLPNADLDASTSALSFLVVKNCTFGLSLNAISVGAGGDLGPVQITTAPGCGWMTSSLDWITMSPGSGIGSGRTEVGVSGNPTGNSRTGTVTIGGQSVAVWQAGAGCTLSAVADNATQPAAGGTLLVTVTATPATCGWSAAAAPEWIQAPGVVTGTGNGTLAYTVLRNFGYYPRTGVIRIGGFVVQVVQKQSDTPPPVPVFTDVPLSHPYADYIGLLRRAAVTVGCSSSTYCPDATVTRGQMAVFLVRSLFGGDLFPYPANPLFTDVPATHPYFSYIQKMKELGITAGCSTTMYCPDDPVTRGQMAVFLIRGRLGIPAGAAFPAAANPFFADVPASHVYFGFIQKMKELGITSGCSATTYCPDSPTTRGQMAVFLIRSFFTP